MDSLRRVLHVLGYVANRWIDRQSVHQKHTIFPWVPLLPTHATALGSPSMDLDYDLHNLAKRGESRGTHDARMLTSNENPQS